MIKASSSGPTTRLSSGGGGNSGGDAAQTPPASPGSSPKPSGLSSASLRFSLDPKKLASQPLQFRKRKPLGSPSTEIRQTGADEPAVKQHDAAVDDQPGNGEQDHPSNDESPVPAQAATAPSSSHVDAAGLQAELEQALRSKVADTTPQQAQAVGHQLTTDYQERRRDFQTMAGEAMDQQMQMQMAKLQIDQKMEIMKMIAEIFKKAVGNYDVK